jgi:hypothetical protein
MTEVKPFRTFIRTYTLFLFKCGHLSANIKTPKTNYDYTSIDSCLSLEGIYSRHPPLKTEAHPKQVPLHHSTFSKVHTSSQFAHSFQLPYVYDYTIIIELCMQQTEVLQNRENEHDKSTETWQNQE